MSVVWWPPVPTPGALAVWLMQWTSHCLTLAFVCASVCLSGLSVSLSVSVCASLSLFLSVCLSGSLSVGVVAMCLSDCPSVCRCCLGVSAPLVGDRYEELVEKYNVTYIAGGATQNSIRVAKWMLQDKGRAAYIGAVGQDQYSKQLEESAAKDGVETHYMHNAEVPTGTCAVCVVKKDRFSFRVVAFFAVCLFVFGCCGREHRS